MPKINHFVVLLFACFLYTSCVAPFSELQDAGTLGKGRLEITPLYSHVIYHDENGSDDVQSHYGIVGGIGAWDRFDLRFRFEGISDYQKLSPKHWVLGFGPKFGILPGVLSLYVPVGFELAHDDTWETHPTVLYSRLVSKGVSINSSMKYMDPISQDKDGVYAVNVGLGLTHRSGAILRPEIGMLFRPDERERYFQFSLGASFRFSR